MFQTHIKTPMFTSEYVWDIQPVHNTNTKKPPSINWILFNIKKIHIF